MRLTLFCPACGQKLEFPADDLRGTFRCPRCQTLHDPSLLVDPAQTLAAIPVSHPAVAAGGSLDPPASDTIRDFSPPTLTPNQPAGDEAATTVYRADLGRQAASVDAIEQPLAAEDTADDGKAIEGGARRSLRAVGRVGLAILRLADRFDSRIYGRRGWIVVGCAVAVVLAPLADGVAETSAFTITLSTLFLLLLLVLTLARVGSFRDENGSWSWSLAWRRSISAGKDAWHYVLDLWQAPPAEKLVRIGLLTASVGLIVLALRTPLHLALESEDQESTGAFDTLDRALLIVGAILSVGGGLAWWRGRRTLRWIGRTNETGMVDGLGADLVERAAGRVPALLSCRDKPGLLKAARESSHPLVQRLLEALAEWRPRPFDYEDEYQASLHRFLSRRIPEGQPEREHPVPSDDGRRPGRIDILLGACVLIEVKHRLTTSKAQKALGQMQMYLEYWKGRGPVVLVVCDTREEAVASFFSAGLRQMRTQGRPVIAILAN